MKKEKFTIKFSKDIFDHEKELSNRLLGIGKNVKPTNRKKTENEPNKQGIP